MTDTTFITLRADLTPLKSDLNTARTLVNQSIAVKPIGIKIDQAAAKTEATKAAKAINQAMKNSPVKLNVDRSAINKMFARPVRLTAKLVVDRSALASLNTAQRIRLQLDQASLANELARARAQILRVTNAPYVIDITGTADLAAMRQELDRLRAQITSMPNVNVGGTGPGARCGMNPAAAGMAAPGGYFGGAGGRFAMGAGAASWMGGGTGTTLGAGFGAMAGGVPGAVIGGGIGKGVDSAANFVAGGIDSLAQTQRIEQMLRAILKDDKAGSELLDAVRALQKEAPQLTKLSLAQSAGALAGANIDPKKIPDMVRVIAEAAATSTLPVEEAMERLTRALYQMQTNGKLSAEEANQASELGIPLRQIISEQFGGRKFDDIAKDSQAGKIDIEDVMDRIFAGLDKRYTGSLARQMETLPGQLAALNAAMLKLKETAAEPLIQPLTEAISKLNVAATAGDFDALAESLAEASTQAVNLTIGVAKMYTDWKEYMDEVFNGDPSGDLDRNLNSQPIVRTEDSKPLNEPQAIAEGLVIRFDELPTSTDDVKDEKTKAYLKSIETRQQFGQPVTEQETADLQRFMATKLQPEQIPERFDRPVVTYVEPPTPAPADVIAEFGTPAAASASAQTEMETFDTKPVTATEANVSTVSDAATELASSLESLASDVQAIDMTTGPAQPSTGTIEGVFANVPQFESGGFTGNTGTSTAAGIVHGKEFVVNAEGTKKYREVLEAMNSGADIPGFTDSDDPQIGSQVTPDPIDIPAPKILVSKQTPETLPAASDSEQITSETIRKITSPVIDNRSDSEKREDDQASAEFRYAEQAAKFASEITEDPSYSLEQVNTAKSYADGRRRFAGAKLAMTPDAKFTGEARLKEQQRLQNELTDDSAEEAYAKRQSLVASAPLSDQGTLPAAAAPETNVGKVADAASKLAVTLESLAGDVQAIDMTTSPGNPPAENSIAPRTESASTEQLEQVNVKVDTQVDVQAESPSTQSPSVEINEPVVSEPVINVAAPEPLQPTRREAATQANNDDAPQTTQPAADPARPDPVEDVAKATKTSGKASAAAIQSVADTLEDMTPAATTVSSQADTVETPQPTPIAAIEPPDTVIESPMVNVSAPDAMVVQTTATDDAKEDQPATQAKQDSDGETAASVASPVVAAAQPSPVESENQKLARETLDKINSPTIDKRSDSEKRKDEFTASRIRIAEQATKFADEITEDPNYSLEQVNTAKEYAQSQRRYAGALIALTPDPSMKMEEQMKLREEFTDEKAEQAYENKRGAFLAKVEASSNRIPKVEGMADQAEPSGTPPIQAVQPSESVSGESLVSVAAPMPDAEPMESPAAQAEAAFDAEQAMQTVDNRTADERAFDEKEHRDGAYLRKRAAKARAELATMESDTIADPAELKAARYVADAADFVATFSDRVTPSPVFTGEDRHDERKRLAFNEYANRETTRRTNNRLIQEATPEEVSAIQRRASEFGLLSNPIFPQSVEGVTGSDSTSMPADYADTIRDQELAASGVDTTVPPTPKSDPMPRVERMRQTAQKMGEIDSQWFVSADDASEAEKLATQFKDDKSLLEGELTNSDVDLEQLTREIYIDYTDSFRRRGETAKSTDMFVVLGRTVALADKNKRAKRNEAKKPKAAPKPQPAPQTDPTQTTESEPAEASTPAEQATPEILQVIDPKPQPADPAPVSLADQFPDATLASTKAKTEQVAPTAPKPPRPKPAIDNRTETERQFDERSADDEQQRNEFEASRLRGELEVLKRDPNATAEQIGGAEYALAAVEDQLAVRENLTPSPELTGYARADEQKRLAAKEVNRQESLRERNTEMLSEASPELQAEIVRQMPEGTTTFPRTVAESAKAAEFAPSVSAITAELADDQQRLAETTAAENEARRVKEEADKAAQRAEQRAAQQAEQRATVTAAETKAVELRRAAEGESDPIQKKAKEYAASAAEFDAEQARNLILPEGLSAEAEITEKAKREAENTRRLGERTVENTRMVGMASEEEQKAIAEQEISSPAFPTAATPEDFYDAEMQRNRLNTQADEIEKQGEGDLYEANRDKGDAEFKRLETSMPEALRQAAKDASQGDAKIESELLKLPATITQEVDDKGNVNNRIALARPDIDRRPSIQTSGVADLTRMMQANVENAQREENKEMVAAAERAEKILNKTKSVMTKIEGNTRPPLKITAVAG
jgi:tape measure domain-containing protein